MTTERGDLERLSDRELIEYLLKLLSRGGTKRLAALLEAMLRLERTH